MSPIKVCLSSGQRTFFDHAEQVVDGHRHHECLEQVVLGKLRKVRQLRLDELIEAAQRGLQVLVGFPEAQQVAVKDEDLFHALDVAQTYARLVFGDLVLDELLRFDHAVHQEPQKGLL